MELEIEKEKICINQIIKKHKENIEVEGDVIIPDIKPDILKCINTCGTVCIYKKEVLDGKVRIDGGINVNIIYMADTEKSGVRGLSTIIDFSKTIEMKEAKPGMNLECKIGLNEIECRILNGRKISLKAILEASLKLNLNDEIELIRSCNNLDDIQVMNNSLNINSLVGRGSTNAQARDTILIDGIDNLSEILKTNVEIVNMETKKSYNKVLIKSDLFVKIMYLTDDGRINNIESKIPVMGFIDMPDITEDDTCDVIYELKNLIIKPNNVEEHSIYVEAEIDFCCLAFQNKEVKIVEDLYSPSCNLNFCSKKIDTDNENQRINDVCSVREKQVIPEIRNEKIYDMDVNWSIKKQSILNNKILIDGELAVKFIYSISKSNGLDVKKILIPFTHSIECSGVSLESNINSNIEILNQDAIVMPDDSIELKIDLNINVDVSKNRVLNVINDINIQESEEDDEPYSIIVYFTKPGDSLWSLAKKFKSTVESISLLNGIEDESKLKIGEQLFIPRYVAKSINV